jgi:hypothetical protein
MHSIRLPHEWYKTMPDLFLVCGITGQIPGKEAFFVNEPPYQTEVARPKPDPLTCKAKAIKARRGFCV